MNGLGDLLAAELRRAFPSRGLRAGTAPGLVAVIPAAHPDVGDVHIWDDVSEARIEVGAITHLHVSCYDDGLSEDERRRRIVAQVLGYLDDLFADRTLLWHSPGPPPRSGGSLPIGLDEPCSFMGQGDVTYLWSGPVPNPLAPDAGDESPRR